MLRLSATGLWGYPDPRLNRFVITPSSPHQTCIFLIQSPAALSSGCGWSAIPSAVLEDRPGDLSQLVGYSNLDDAGRAAGQEGRNPPGCPRGLAASVSQERAGS